MSEDSLNRKQFTLEMNEKREELITELEEKLLPRIGKSSTSAVIEESFRLALQYIEKVEEIEEEIADEKLEWSTENFELRIEK